MTLVSQILALSPALALKRGVNEPNPERVLKRSCFNSSETETETNDAIVDTYRSVPLLEVRSPLLLRGRPVVARRSTAVHHACTQYARARVHDVVRATRLPDAGRGLLTFAPALPSRRYV